MGERITLFRVDHTGRSREYLWNADADCDHDIQPNGGSGCKCTRCGGWFCY